MSRHTRTGPGRSLEAAEIPEPFRPLLFHPPFAFLSSSRVLASVGFQMLGVAVGWQLYELTGSALDLGLVGLVQFVPMVLLTLVVGQVADRCDRRLVVVVCEAAKAGAAALAFGSLGGWQSRASIFTLVGLLGAAQAFENPAMTALVPEVVSRPLITKAMAWVISAGQTAQIVGPALGGLLYALGPTGLGILRSAPAVGALATSVLLAHYPMEHRIGPALFRSVIVFGAATVTFGVSTSFALSIFALTVLGAADVVSMVIRVSLAQIRTPDAMRGRVSAVHSLFTGTSNQLGAFESGVAAALLGVVPAVLLGGLGTVAIAGLWMVLFPELRHLGRFEE
jgi:transmembrane secretion effector